METRCGMRRRCSRRRHCNRSATCTCTNPEFLKATFSLSSWVLTLAWSMLAECRRCNLCCVSAVISNPSALLCLPCLHCLLYSLAEIAHLWHSSWSFPRGIFNFFHSRVLDVGGLPKVNPVLHLCFYFPLVSAVGSNMFALFVEKLSKD